MGENKKRMMEAINRSFEEGSEVMPVAESLYYMKAALLLHYGKKYPKQKAAITEVCEMIGRLLGAQEPQGGGGAGMIYGWQERIGEEEGEVTQDHIAEMADRINRIGHIRCDADGSLHCTGTDYRTMSQEEAQRVMAETWNSLGELLDEMARLQEDHARMTYTLRTIAGKAMDAMQGTARSQIAADWWQAQD